ncbi:MAG TPA: hypothetical protein VN578_11010 [Candidatus Binatia bacterium]|jgi:hypothetical protein|nr:hypothetical protein [Candidatus Binatia bacterium]
MDDFILLDADSSGGHGLPPTYLVAVGVGMHGQHGWWKDHVVMGSDCVTHEEWDHMVNRLIKSLETVRRKGHAKLEKNYSQTGATMAEVK